MKRAFFAIVLLVSCSESMPLGTQGAKCEYDEQCAQGYVCKCVRRRNPDADGPDEILSPGICNKDASLKCPSDAGVADTAFDSPPLIDTAPETSPAETATDVSDDASDGG